MLPAVRTAMPRWIALSGMLLAGGCRARGEAPSSPTSDAAPPVGAQSEDLPVAAAATCPQSDRCLSIFDDIVALGRFEDRLPRLSSAETTGHIGPGPISVWMVVVDGTRLMPVAELPIPDAASYVAELAPAGTSPERVAPGAYTIDELSVIDMGDTVLLCPEWEVAVEVADGLRPLVPSDTGLIMSAWLYLDAIPNALYQQLDSAIAERMEDAYARGDSRSVGRLSTAVRLVIETSLVELELWEDGEDWIAQLRIEPVPDTWWADKATDNLGARCRLPGIFSGSTPALSLAMCERALFADDDREFLRENMDQARDAFGPFAGPVLRLVEGALAEDFALELAAAVPMDRPTLELALRTPDGEAFSQLLTMASPLLSGSQMLDDVQLRVEDGRPVWRTTARFRSLKMPVAATMEGDVFVAVVGEGTPIAELAGRVRAQQEAPVDRMRVSVRLPPDVIAGLPEDQRASAKLFDNTITLTSEGDPAVHVMRLRISSRFLHSLVLSDQAARSSAAPDAPAVLEPGA